MIDYFHLSILRTQTGASAWTIGDSSIAAKNFSFLIQAIFSRIYAPVESDLAETFLMVQNLKRSVLA